MGQSMVKFYPQCIIYSSHVLTFLRHLNNNPDKMEASLGFAEVLAHCGWYHLERGQFDTAFSILERAKFICNQVMSDEKNLIVALVYNNLGGVYVSWSKREEAEVCIKTCIQHREACLTRDDAQIQELATVYSSHANLLRKEELHWEESRLYYEKALDIRKTCPGCTPELLEHTLFNYANWFLQQGLVEEGFSYLLEAKELHSLFERISKNQLYTMYTIGKVEYIRRHTMKSYGTHKECLNHRVRLEGENHFLTGVSLHKVDCLAFELGNIDECILYLQRALEVFRNTTGDRGLLPRTLIQLGRILTVKGNQDLDQETQEVGEAMLSEGTELAKQHRGRNVPLETEADFNRLVKTTYQ
ncbi:Nb-arc and tpr domain protein [Penicillium lividum]|nr:Nb-arc and tpr domain protein [Penicillium lividum]